MEKSSLKQIHHELNWGEGDLVAAGFSWPPRSYICSFCKREFRSAQALGGHMNVHRRDRARLRQLSPTAADTCNSNPGNFSLLNLNLDPNPGFNPNPSSLLTKFPHFSSKLPPPADLIKWGGDGAVQPPITTDFMKPKGLFEDLKKSSSEFVTLDLEIGLISQSKEELDLELRLGYT